MNIIKKMKLLPRANRQRGVVVDLVVLHDTAGPTLAGAESTLKQRGLGYHYMIDKDGQAYQYAEPHETLYHAIGFNEGTVAISFVGGGDYGEVNERQIHSCIDLIEEVMTLKHPKVQLEGVTCHKHVNKGRKIDPRFPGEPPHGVNLEIDRKWMKQIADATGLTFRTKFPKY